MISPQRIEQVMRDTGMDRMQAVNHLRQRDELNARRNRFAFQNDRVEPYDPTVTLNRQIKAARESMGEDRWIELNAEWE